MNTPDYKASLEKANMPQRLLNDVMNMLQETLPPDQYGDFFINLQRELSTQLSSRIAKLKEECYSLEAQQADMQTSLNLIVPPTSEPINNYVP